MIYIAKVMLQRFVTTNSKNVQMLEYIYIYIQGVTGGTDQTSGECSLGQTIPI